MSFFGRTKRLEEQIAFLRGELRDVRDQLCEIRAACTMRVGELPVGYFMNPYRTDPRPVLTAMDAVQKLMADAGIEPKAIEPKGACVQFVQKEKE